MYTRIKKSFKHTLVYGLGNIATKLVGFVLVPLYTKNLSVAEYGVLGILETTLLIGVQVLDLGQRNGLMRFFTQKQEGVERKQYFFTFFTFLCFAGLVWGGLTYLSAPALASFFKESDIFLIYFRLLAGVTFLRILNNFFLSWLRIQERAGHYVFMNLFRLVTILGLNVYFVAYAHAAVKGIMIGFLAAEIVLFFILLPQMLSNMAFHFSTKDIRQSLGFGFPLIFTSLAGMLLTVGNRYVLKLLTDYHEVGLYNLGHKVGSLFNVLLIQSFSLGLLPLIYKAYGEPGDRRYYSKMLTYFGFVLVWSGLALGLYSTELIHRFALNSDYWPATSIVPIIILAYVFSGGNWLVSLSMYLTEKTQVVAWNNIIAVIVSLGLNFLLIPFFGMAGAAWAMLISFILLYGISYFKAKVYFPVPYENIKLLKILIAGCALYGISRFLTFKQVWIVYGLKAVLFLLFPVLLFAWRFFEPVEIERIRWLPGAIVQRTKSTIQSLRGRL